LQAWQPCSKVLTLAEEAQILSKVFESQQREGLKSDLTIDFFRGIARKIMMKDETKLKRFCSVKGIFCFFLVQEKRSFPNRGSKLKKEQRKSCFIE